MMNAAEKLPTLAAVSQAGWRGIYETSRDLWSDAERVSGRLNTGGQDLFFVRFNRLSTPTETVIVNHGGPHGNINEGWRYLFNPSRQNVILPLQGDLNDETRKQHVHCGLTDLSESINVLHRALSGGKAALAGTSWGGTVSLAYAALYPDLVTKVVISSPVAPLDRALDWLISPYGGFARNSDLCNLFFDEIGGLANVRARDVFRTYFQKLMSSSDRSRTVRAFSALFYSVMGDFGENISANSVPTNGMSFDRALGFAYLASLRKPFSLDEKRFLRGLRSLRELNVPVHIITGREDRSSGGANTISFIQDLSGATLHTTSGGHSSTEAKTMIRKLLVADAV